MTEQRESKSSKSSRRRVQNRLQDLRAIQAELALDGAELTTAMIMERFEISKRQAHRYLKKLKEMPKSPLNAHVGMTLAGRYLRSIPAVNDVLTGDLEILNALKGNSKADDLSLIKARREQALAIARLGGQFLKELRELGLLEKAPSSASSPWDAENGLLGSPEEFDPEIADIAERELIEFERELGEISSKTRTLP